MFREFYRRTNVDKTYAQLSQGLEAVNGHASKSENGAKTPLEEHFENLDISIRKELFSRYSGDYAAFGYPIPDFMKFEE